MDWINIVVSIIIGLGTGVLSSWFISSRYEKRSIKQAKIREFRDDKQQLYNYLMHIFDELNQIEQSIDTGRLVWILGTKPFCNQLNELKQELKSDEAELLNRIDKLVEDIYEFCFSRECALYFSEIEKAQICNWANEVAGMANKLKQISYPQQKKSKS